MSDIQAATGQVLVCVGRGKEAFGGTAAGVTGNRKVRQYVVAGWLRWIYHVISTYSVPSIIQREAWRAATSHQHQPLGSHRS